MTSTYQLLQVARDAAAEGRNVEYAAVLDEIGADVVHVRRTTSRQSFPHDTHESQRRLLEWQNGPRFQWREWAVDDLGGGRYAISIDHGDINSAGVVTVRAVQTTPAVFSISAEWWER